ncbi:uncharacterized protein LOC116032193 [Ipomoea triloba]|uniref:uncharacterized protein LOC116032193 n=1 Tax=Ipomoea triloba TaxID=35885 RepID=UPI00125DE173|nr:uncharacterized protein LOC116032193 [Ipomoea triloba]
MKLSCCSFITFNATPPRRTLFSLRPPRFSGESTHSHGVSLAESLQSETLEILEWPAVCSQLAAFTSTSMGLSTAQSARIPLGRSPEESRRLLAQTSAAVAVPRPLDFSGIEDVSRIVDTAVAGQMLSIREICAVKRTLIAARSLLKQLEEISFQSELCERWSPLIEILQNCDFLVELAHHIEFCIDCDLSVILDRASEELEIVRSERKRNMENLELMLKQVSSRIFQAGGIDRPLVTKRRSRMCVGVRASHRSLLPNGVVLNVSSTGSTYFMEPEGAVELNNMEVKLSSEERNEEQAILSSLTSEIAQSKMKIMCLLDRMLEMDLAFARAAHAHWMNGVCPALSSENCDDQRFNDLSVDIEGIKHPLLLECSLRRLPDIVRFKSRSSLYSDQRNDATDFESVTRSSAFPVPIDIKIEHGTRVVVISGPNTGGKTASMKTLGLASVMFKAGMYLPAQNKPRLPWFDLILTDIGDNQSVEQNLSTFSGHMLRLCKILEAASESSLILVDEIGSGTDPSEGVALATSILQYIKERVNLAVVTTHYGDLTRLKEKDNRFSNAAMEFSLDTLQPTFRILWGSMGESNALMIAKSIGVNESIINRAQSWVNKLTPDKMQEQKGLLYQSLVEERDRLETQAKKAASLHSNIMNLFQEIRDEAQDLDEREKALKTKETQKIQQEVRAVKRELEAVLKDFENQLKTIDILEVNSLIKKSESAISSIIEAHQPSKELVRETGQSFYTPRVGEQVLLKSLGNKLATIVEEPGDDETVLVQYGKIRVRVDKSNIRALPTNSATVSVPSSRTQGQGIKNLKELRSLTAANNITQDSYGPVVQTSKNSVDLRGMRAEEASHHLRMAIDARPPNSVLFVVHGMGTGVIKELALKLLRDHPRVVKFEQESPLNYGCTVAYIK